MRKFAYCATGTLFLAAAVCSFSACGGGNGRSSYTIRAEYFPEERTLEAQMKFSFFNATDNALSELRFELYSNAYREGARFAPVSALYEPSAYYCGKSYGGFTLSGAQGVKEYGVCGEDENILSVTLPDPVYPDERAEITIDYTVSLAQVNHRLGAGENAVNLANFYPVLCAYGEGGFLEYVYSSNGDPFVSECADYEVYLTVPKSYRAVGTGKEERVAENGKATYHVIAENVRDVAFVLGEHFQSASQSVGGVEVRYFWFADEDPQRTLATAAESFAFYARTFGKYAYPCYTVVETDFPYGGMEYPMLSMISSSLREEDVPVAVAHETAHQWWYSAVGNNQFEHAWMDEGLAEYSSALFFNAQPVGGLTGEALVKRAESSYRAFFSVYSQLHENADTTMNRPLTSFSGEYEYANIAYDKGMILFDRLRSSVGDRRFYAGLKKYYSDFSYKIAEPSDLISCFSGIGSGAEGLFRSFTDGLCVI